MNNIEKLAGKLYRISRGKCDVTFKINETTKTIMLIVGNIKVDNAQLSALKRFTEFAKFKLYLTKDDLNCFKDYDFIKTLKKLIAEAENTLSINKDAYFINSLKYTALIKIVGVTK